MILSGLLVQLGGEFFDSLPESKAARTFSMIAVW